MSCGYYYATRKSDAQRCIVWIYHDADDVQRVSCCRTHDATLEDFHILGPVVDPFGVPFEDEIG